MWSSWQRQCPLIGNRTQSGTAIADILSSQNLGSDLQFTNNHNINMVDSLSVAHNWISWNSSDNVTYRYLAGNQMAINNTSGTTRMFINDSLFLVNNTLEANQFIADRGTACTNGELALRAGFGTTATVTAVAGQGQTCEWTITSSGTGQAANPTITDTLTNALPSASVVCDMRMVGGTGTSRLIDQTTLSATAPIFTFGGTPVAASTYKVVRRCGP